MSIRREGYGRPVIICTAGDDSIAVFFSLSLVRYATTLAAERERIYNNFRRSLTRAPGGKQMVVVVFFFGGRSTSGRASKERKQRVRRRRNTISLESTRIKVYRPSSSAAYHGLFSQSGRVRKTSGFLEF